MDSEMHVLFLFCKNTLVQINTSEVYLVFDCIIFKLFMSIAAFHLTTNSTLFLGYNDAHANRE